ncbi:major facilitator superfamily multidrug transporter [Rhodococcus opacus]|uniref:Major facilitator superfamily multidrug transporter n=1 Tax=Rhodococcus opacus TaxID=37919 RepID=A0A1B1K2Z0_RHOOP|nr:MFS transporter [Rhodococcus opacus]ANS26983.1 major facilitator superfamily multidrug transporter [Rhodococcus opacus]
MAAGSTTAARALLPVMCFVVMIVAVLQTLVVPIVGTIGAQLDVGPTAVGWLLTANLLAAATATPVLGRLADLRGKRPVLLGVLVVVLLGSLIGALSTSVGVLIFARVLQGVSFALFPIGIAVLRDELPAEKLTGAMGIFSGTLGFGGCFGIVLTGVLVSDGADFHRIFWLSSAITAAGLVLAWIAIPRRPRVGTGSIDWIGAAGLAAGLVLVLLPLAEGGTWGWTSPVTIVSGIAGILVLIGWFLYERRITDPLVAPRLLTNPPVLVTHVSALVVGMSMFVMFLGSSYFVQTPRAVAGYGFGATVLEASTVYLLPGAISGVLASILSGKLIHRFGSRAVLIAASVVGVSGFVVFVFAHDRTWEVIAAILLVNTYISLAYASLPSLLVAEVRQDETGVANSINSIARSVGSSFASALLATLLAGITIDGTDVPTESAYVIAFVVGATAAALAGLLPFFGITRTTRTPSDEEEDEVHATALAAEWGTVGGLGGANTRGSGERSGQSVRLAPES